MKICSCSLAGTDSCRTCSNYPYSIHIVNDLVESVSSVQPERKKGTWLTDGGRQECSVCHTNFPDLYPLYDYASYCPNCGADMGGVQV